MRIGSGSSQFATSFYAIGNPRPEIARESTGAEVPSRNRRKRFTVGAREIGNRWFTPCGTVLLSVWKIWSPLVVVSAQCVEYETQPQPPTHVEI